MGQNDLFEKLYGEPAPRPTEEPAKAPPHLKSRSARAYLETLKNGHEQSPDFRATDTGSAPG